MYNRYIYIPTKYTLQRSPGLETNCHGQAVRTPKVTFKPAASTLWAPHGPHMSLPFPFSYLNARATVHGVKVLAIGP